jgi:hypothetical protein
MAYLNMNWQSVTDLYGQSLLKGYQLSFIKLISKFHWIMTFFISQLLRYFNLNLIVSFLIINKIYKPQTVS